MHSVVSFLRRPQLLSAFQWNSSAARSTNLFQPAGRTEGLLVPSGLFSNRPMLARKLDGFTSFRATCVLKLQINAQPFQCGRLLMAAAPMPGLLGNRRQFIFSHVSNTQNLNHVQMDIAKDTEVELRIPFISPYNSYDLIDGKFDWAEVRILVYSPLNAVESTCLQCLVYGHFEDIEMGAPTSGGVKQQSLMPSKLAVDSTKSEEATGKFTGALAQLGSSLVNKGLSIARPITSSVDSVIAAMGWSKPILAKPSRIFMNRPTEGFQYMDGVDHSLMLGMTASNAVEPIKGLVGTNLDETSFDTLKRIPQMIGVFSYSNQILTCGTSSTPVKLWDCAVSPNCNIPACYYVTPTADATKNIVDPYSLSWKQPTTLNYITSPFLYWKGSLVYTFKFVKTNYHSGRVEISYHPFVNSVDATRMDFVYRAVIDLRENSEISLTVPYIAAQPYKRISTFLDPINPNPPAPGRLKDIISGVLYVRALTPLICATQIIANSIEVLVEMRAGDDFEVAGPVTSKFLPFSIQNPNPVQQSDCMKLKKKRAQEKCLDKEKNPKQQSGVSNLRVPAVRKRIGTDVSAWTKSVYNLPGYTDVSMIGLDIHYDAAIVQPVLSTSIPMDFYISVNIASSWLSEDINLLMAGRFMAKQFYLTVPNLKNSDIFDFTVTRLAFNNSSVKNQVWMNIDFNIYPIKDGFQNITINPQQLPLPIASEGGGGNVVKIDESQLPLPIEYQHKDTDPPVPVVLQNLPITVKPPVEDWFAVKIDKSQVPLPVSGNGGGGGSGGTVTINPDQLPLWTSEYNVAPLNPRAPSTNPAQQAGQLALAGVTETRTRALEGWMPPSITGSSKDAHRPKLTNLCIGENFNSFRQYAKRFAFCMTSGVRSDQMMSIQPVELIRPGALCLRPTTTTALNNGRTQLCLYAVNSKAELSGSPLSFVAGMYAFYRGSIRTKVWMDPRESPPNMISGHLEYTRQIVDVNVINDNIENFMTPIAYEIPQQKQIAEFQVPYYSPTIVSSTWSHGVDNQFDVPLVNLVLSIPDERKDTPETLPTEQPPPPKSYPIKVAVAAGDDMDFHQFIGPPPVINVGDITLADRPLHYPPTGFTPTQKIMPDPNWQNQRYEQPASSFVPVDYSTLKVQNNASGGSCPKVPSTAAITVADRTREPKGIPDVTRIKRSIKEGDDVVDTKLPPSSTCPCSHTTLSDYEYE